jgi:hypothetical protein
MVALLSFSNNLLDQRASNIVLFFASWSSPACHDDAILS